MSKQKLDTASPAWNIDELTGVPVFRDPENAFRVLSEASKKLQAEKASSDTATPPWMQLQKPLRMNDPEWEAEQIA